MISPGPGDPDHAGVSVDIVKVAAERRIPLLGVCLGMQSMGTAYGASIVRAPTLVHGEASEVVHDGTGLLEGMPETFPAARYHSLMVDPATLPADLYVTATSPEDGVVMGLRHRSLPIEGVQFHPESVLTPDGPHLLANFLRLAGEGEASRLDAVTVRSRPGAWPSSSTSRPQRGGRARRSRDRVMSELVRAAVAAIVDGRSLSQDDARLAMGAVMDGEATPSQLAALLMGLRMRGETVDELAGFASAMRERVTCASRRPRGRSTSSGPEATVRGRSTSRRRRRWSSRRWACRSRSTATGRSPRSRGRPTSSTPWASGSTTTRPRRALSLAEHGFAFLFAPTFHPAMRHAGPTRREIGVRTAFNLIGPLTNPAGATRALIGVGVADAAPRIAEVAQRLGTERTFVVHGDGVDELPLDDTGVLYHVGPEGIERHEIRATKLGFTRCVDEEAGRRDGRGTTRGWSRPCCGGEPGARRDVVLLNAAAALLVAGVVGQMEEGIDKAALAIDAGARRGAAGPAARGAARGRCGEGRPPRPTQASPA